MKNKERGFTLIEAMVAIIILSSSLFATFSWVNVGIETLVRAENTLEQEVLIDELIEQLYVTNLSDVRKGRLERGVLVLEWQASPVDSRSGVNNRGVRGLYDHTLHELKIDVLRGGNKVGSHRTRMVTSRRVRNPQFEL